MKRRRPSLFFTVLWSGFLVGSLDIGAAFANTWYSAHRGPAPVLQYIASGVLGKHAFKGGTDVIVYGSLIHFTIAYAFTAFFFLIYPKLKFLHDSSILSGILYGLFIWLVMNLGVVPLTKIPKGHLRVSQAAFGAAILMVMIGIPLAMIAKRYYRVKR